MMGIVLLMACLEKDLSFILNMLQVVYDCYSVYWLTCLDEIFFINVLFVVYDCHHSHIDMF